MTSRTWNSQPAWPLSRHLLATPEPSELDERGCFSKESTAEVERILIEAMTPEVKAFVIPPLPPADYIPTDRWRLASCLQKAIRFCLPSVAMAAANGLYSVDRTYARQRLGVILVEDVMTGDPLLTARALAMLGQPEWRREVDERKVVIWFAKLAAEADKDRSAVELSVMVDEDRDLDIPGMARLKDDDLAHVISRPQNRLIDRIAAAHVLVGPRFGSDRIPEVGLRSATTLFALMVQLGLSRWALYVAAKTASRLRDSMFISMPLIDTWLRTGERSVVVGPDFPQPMIGDLLGAAYDRYTRQGLKAIDRFAREVLEVEQFIQAVVPAKRKYAAGVGVFLGEGGVLARRTVYSPESEAAYRWVRSPDRMWWLPRDLAGEYLDAVRRNLGRLNEIRRELVFAATPGPRQEAL